MIIEGVRFGLLEVVAVVAWAIVASAFIFISTRLHVKALVRSAIGSLMFLTMMLVVFYVRFGITLFGTMLVLMVSLLIMGVTYPALRLADRRLQKTKARNDIPKQGEK